MAHVQSGSCVLHVESLHGTVLCHRNMITCHTLCRLWLICITSSAACLDKCVVCYMAGSARCVSDVEVRQCILFLFLVRLYI